MIFAQIRNNTIVNTIILDDLNLLSLFQKDNTGAPYDSLVQIDQIYPRPGIGWTFDNIIWSPPVELDNG